MQRKSRPIKAKNFLKAALEDLEKLRGTYLYEVLKQSYLEKTEQQNGGHREWLQNAIPYLIQRYNLKNEPRILDLGCGTGEMTVLMNVSGFQATGIDLHEKHLSLAKILAEENELPQDTFILNNQNSLPFPHKSFDIVLMLVVLEHLSDTELEWLLPELYRICNGIIYVIVPNKMRTVDDHTDLRVVPWMPRSLANWYIKVRGQKYRYAISEDGTWDVYYRTFRRIESVFKYFGFEVDFPPDDLVWPPLKLVLPVFQYNKSSVFWKKPIYFFFETLHSILIKTGLPKQALYTYMNLIFIPKDHI